jgi:hypothetical protein
MDVSDENIFPLAAEPGEWAITGTFAFADASADQMNNKEQLAFRNGWMGTASFGRSTLVQVASINEQDYAEVIRDLATYLFESCGAPDMMAALDAAREEVSDAKDISDHPVGTLLSIERDLTSEGVVERVHVLEDQTERLHAQIWSIESNGS